MPISSKRIDLSGAHSTGVGQTHSLWVYDAKFINNDQMARKPRKDKPTPSLELRWE